MSGSPLAVILIPIVIGVVLAVWITAVYHANRHPKPGRNVRPHRKVIGGAFENADGRQLMPRRDEPAAEPSGPNVVHPEEETTAGRAHAARMARWAGRTRVGDDELADDHNKT
jgi:hypothetical protein